MAHPSEVFPDQDQVERELKKIHEANPGDPATSLAKTAIDSDEVESIVKMGIQFQENISAVFRAMSAFFSRDNTGLPGIGLLFKVQSQCELNCVWLMIEFLTRRGQRPQIGAQAAPPKDFTHGKETSDVLYCFEKALAMLKVQHTKASMLYQKAHERNDALAVCFATCMVDAASIKVKQYSHYVAHLKVVQSDKHAIKEFCRRLPFEIEDFAFATGAESVIPTRLMMDPVFRAKENETKWFNPECYHDIKTRRVFNRVT
ncbi:hypothetical protein WJX72_007632 [[Myrmecia] bisecta]|uniref:Ferritin/DPS domain-containing protein n=1 Tax=[Myrmecia] bisecta TaxID=41462 RepID=A0AAW1PPR5_9CHLO